MKAWILAGIAYIAYATIVLTVLLPKINPQPFSEPSANVSSSAPDTPEPTISGLQALLNNERTKAGLTILGSDPMLNKSAQAKADDMSAYNYFGHSNPTTGKMGYSYVTDNTDKCYRYSENITETISAEQAVTAWMNSEAHRNALLNPTYDLSGVGIAKHGRTYYFVQHFCDIM